ncbi:MAG: hypothetical protein F8N37_10650 [Telmatospirillum sp.]|nr:hypothetical protein [Telmatospirillum sp.]
MPSKRKRGDQKTADPAKVVHDLVHFFTPSFLQSGWNERLILLEQIDAQIANDFDDDIICRQISQSFTFEIIKRIKFDVVICKEQAYILLNSNDERHRQAARAWFIINQVPCALLDEDRATASPPGADLRLAPRHFVDLRGMIASNDCLSSVRLIDISATGARITVDSPPAAGTRIILDIPLLGRVAAMVVWVATSLVGLSFLFETINTAAI